jgi:hypothetical protein
MPQIARAGVDQSQSKNRFKAGPPPFENSFEIMAVPRGPHRHRKSNYLARKWDTESFHGIIRLFATSVPLKCPLLDNSGHHRVSAGGRFVRFGRMRQEFSDVHF